MITSELIAKNEVLNTLTDEQKNAILVLSENEEKNSFGSKLGEIYRQLDATIEKTTGIKRDGDEKTYLYLERAAKAVAAERNKLTSENETLKKTIQEGGSDSALKAENEQYKKDFSDLTNKFLKLQKDTETLKANHAKELKNFAVENSLNGAFSGFKFKNTIPESVVILCKYQVFDKIKNYNTEFVKTDSGDVLVFKDENGVIMRNDENGLRPYTAVELLKKEFNNFGILDTGAAGGVGSKNTEQQYNGIGARTRVEAYDMISKMLLQKGLTVGSDEFNSQMSEIWKANNVSALPEK